MIDTPIFFERNRVGRVYKGGMLFSEFFGDKPEDGFMPEEWIASDVKAINKTRVRKREGISKLKDRNIYFDKLLEKYPKSMLGPKKKLRVLVKILDSAIRLPAQAHPDREFSKKYFKSEYGKTESWILLGKRENAKIYFGFKDGVNEQDFLDAIEKSKTDETAMENLMKSFEPEIGDVYLVPAKTVHAIGAGCLILEIQEPTDFTIQPEYRCGDYMLDEKEMYIGLQKSDAIKCFDFGKAPNAKIEPRTLSLNDGIMYENLIGDENTKCFTVNRITLQDESFVINVKNSYGIYIVTNGKGNLRGDGYIKQIEKGDYFFVPFSLMGKFSIEGNCQVVECY